MDGNASASGLSWGNATTMTAALEQASDGDCIYVAAGTYSPELPLTSSDSGDKCNRTFVCNKTFDGKSYLYPLLPLNGKKLLRRMFRVNLK